ncbi:alpha/beta fold hydrolase [Roseomonas sp. 18066]|uniref:alpha/beta fold hydrolase n=1 Tax=Roseomonas sp. 18066 TaxID=2681412 RepID=UPI001356F90F|nr:alpha/beta hydrolase [Roseomonas sp. 18066]
MFFPDFTLEERQVEGETVRLRRGGAGPPLLLLHGNPQTHAMWHKVAPVLAQRFTVICPDIRGYGLTQSPPPSADHAAHSKRAMARQLLGLMQGLGHERFQVLAHDRGARVAHRLALDAPQAVQRLALLDIVPTLEHFERTDMAFALGYYHWFWLAQPHDLPERMILRDVEDWFDLHTGREPKDRSFFHPVARADYLAALRSPGTVASICEDYRAATSIDLEHDRASRQDGQKIACPLLVLWGAKGKIGQWYQPVELWRQYASDSVDGHAVASGHYLAEEAPDEVLRAAGEFFTS